MMPPPRKINLIILWLALSVILTDRPALGFHVGSTASCRCCRLRQPSSSIDRILKRPSSSSGGGGAVFFPLRASTDSSSSSSNPPLVTTPLPTAQQSKKEKRILLLWIHTISIFVVSNYIRKSLWPAFFLLIPVTVWNLIHALSAMLFAGGIVTTTLLEWNLPSILLQGASGGTNENKEQEQQQPQQSNNAQQSAGATLLSWLWQVESKIVLPAVTMSLISGVAQSFHNYNSLRFAPRHVKSALHVMFLFGLWWAWTDRRSQASLRKDGFDESKVVQRRVSNIVSCVFLVALYGIMILKPGT